jgi:hypothetical protein
MRYKYHKGSEADFEGRKLAVMVVKSGRTGIIYYLGKEYIGKEQIVEYAGDTIIAHRELIPEEKESVTIINNSTDQLITERGSRYGKFKDGADIMQSLKDTMRDVDGWNNLTASQKEALDMIQHKIGRILNGDPTYDDSWKDIAGYATLIVNELNGEAK